MTHAENNLWMPPTRLREYQRAKLLGAALFVLLFVGWLVVQWSNPAMRYAVIALIVLTIWTTLSSIFTDERRSRGRQVVVRDGLIQAVVGGRQISVPVGEIALAQWREPAAGDDAGMSFYDAQGRVLLRLNMDILADEDEARVFLGWARKRTELPFTIQWPKPA